MGLTVLSTPYLLGKVKGAVAAYSLRKLRAGVTNAIRVRRSTDNSELDIGFSGQNLDTTTLLSFVGSGSGYISKWYDQSGNNNDAVQTTATAQPRIVNAGVFDASKYYDGVDDYIKVVDSASLKSADVSGIVTFKPSAINLDRILLSYGNGTQYSTNNYQLSIHGGNIVVQGRTPTTILASNIFPAIDTVIQVGFRYSNGSLTFFANGTKGNTVSVNFSTDNATGLFIGCANGTANFLQGNIYDVTIFNRQLTDTEFANYYKDTKKKIPSLP